MASKTKIDIVFVSTPSEIRDAIKSILSQQK